MGGLHFVPNVYLAHIKHDQYQIRSLGEPPLRLGFGFGFGLGLESGRVGCKSPTNAVEFVTSADALLFAGQNPRSVEERETFQKWTRARHHLELIEKRSAIAAQASIRQVGLNSQGSVGVTVHMAHSWSRFKTRAWISYCSTRIYLRGSHTVVPEYTSVERWRAPARPLRFPAQQSRPARGTPPSDRGPGSGFASVRVSGSNVGESEHSGWAAP